MLTAAYFTLLKLKPIQRLLSVLIFTMAVAIEGFAHTPICNCYDNGDDTITCEGGFSDGASAKGVQILVVSIAGKVLTQGQMGDASDYTFIKPRDDFLIQYLAGEGHKIEIDSRDIEE